MNTGCFASVVKMLCLVLLTVLCWTSAALAEAPGSIKGRVLDKETGEPLIGVNVLIQGTSLGTATDIDGRFHLPVVPAGTWTIKASCIGYAQSLHEVTLKSDSTFIVEFRLKAQAIQGEEVIVTVQARGQNDAINQQVTSDRIANIVSSARIQELPDANAAESIGRLPGVSLVRSGGEATQVTIRGLEPKYNSITINGVALPSTSSGDRSTDLSMISSTSLDGIEVYKTVTADMDAAVVGGVVNFDVRCAKPSSEDVPFLSLNVQGAYKDMVGSYGDYKYVASIEKRFFNDKFGLFAQGVAQKQNLFTLNKLANKYIRLPHVIYGGIILIEKKLRELKDSHYALADLPS